MDSEYQAYKNIESLGGGELVRAATPLEATLPIHPTMVLTNPLPYVMDLLVWEVRCSCSSP